MRKLKARISKFEENIRAIIISINNNEQFVENVNDTSKYCLKGMG